MTASIYTRAAATVLRLLEKYGRDVTLRQLTVGTYNTADGSNTQSTTADHDRQGAMFDYPAGQTVSRGTLIQTGDKQMYIDAGTYEPTTTDIVIDADSVQYTIVGVHAIKPADKAVAYELHLRV